MEPDCSLKYQLEARLFLSSCAETSGISNPRKEKGKQWRKRRRNTDEKRPSGWHCYYSKPTLPFILAPDPQRSACLRLRRAQRETKQLPNSGCKPSVTRFRISVLLWSRGPHLPRMRLSGERLEIAEPIQVSVSPLIPGQW